MSRMLAYVSPTPLTVAEAAGDPLLADLQSLATVHSDGWGTAWADATGAIQQTGETSPLGESGNAAELAPEASRMRLMYLRFASRGSAPSVANIQPFLREGVAFQHNGALTPLDGAMVLLGEHPAAGLLGTTDSEVYFAVVRQRAVQIGGAEWQSTSVLVQALRQTIGELRAIYPAACLNAFLLTPEALIVAQSPGSSSVPLEAFARRGFAPHALPPGHDASYNTLRWTTAPSGAVLVATSGIDTTGWSHITDDTVVVFEHSAQSRLPISAVVGVVPLGA
ncbi:class II glutamine amidotransferase [Salinibacterium hongtaonis]|uniref:Glutamine amidotransferase type-2 domain-containing protein n=1 Tax=Homoserinimonas hongtaonis TaxID=2079791 RepID=A0A2U1SYE0_9MICO|nr:class II glutamine amidotransferase [Salinibacterium hongtaonis]PWB96626.1 hypothetical protein DF220_01325 [Salinibacterium hongtaonis]